MEGVVYSTNILNLDIINQFFNRLSYTPKYGEIQEERVVEFTVPGFDTDTLEGGILKEWQRLPIQIMKIPGFDDSYIFKEQNKSNNLKEKK